MSFPLKYRIDSSPHSDKLWKLSTYTILVTELEINKGTLTALTTSIYMLTLRQPFVGKTFFSPSLEQSFSDEGLMLEHQLSIHYVDSFY